MKPTIVKGGLSNGDVSEGAQFNSQLEHRPLWLVSLRHFSFTLLDKGTVQLTLRLTSVFAYNIINM
jgi:hypothetical protein